MDIEVSSLGELIFGAVCARIKKLALSSSLV
jgi:hypothetical protein